jgi:hypothetical protein
VKGKITLVFIIKIGYDFFEIILAERGEYLLLIFLAHNDMAVSDDDYLISFSIELISNSFYSIKF